MKHFKTMQMDMGMMNGTGMMCRMFSYAKPNLIMCIDRCR